MPKKKNRNRIHQKNAAKKKKYKQKLQNRKRRIEHYRSDLVSSEGRGEYQRQATNEAMGFLTGLIHQKGEDKKPLGK